MIVTHYYCCTPTSLLVYMPLCVFFPREFDRKRQRNTGKLCRASKQKSISKEILQTPNWIPLSYLFIYLCNSCYATLTRFWKWNSRGSRSEQEQITEQKRLPSAAEPCVPPVTTRLCFHGASTCSVSHVSESSTRTHEQPVETVTGGLHFQQNEVSFVANEAIFVCNVFAYPTENNDWA